MRADVDRLVCDAVSTDTIELVRCSKRAPLTNAAARWRQLRVRMGQLTRGLKHSWHDGLHYDGKTIVCHASILHKDFWLEALDKHHRYGFHLRAFHKAWKHEMATYEDHGHNNCKNASFFDWLDHGNGQYVELPECTQHGLRSTRVEYCNAEERQVYKLEFVALKESKAVRVQYAMSQRVIHTDERSKWIFVIDLSGFMYLGRKRKGRFHHSSFVSGAPIVAAGKIIIKNGIILAVEPHSGHFKPRLENLQALCSILATHGVDIDRIAFIKPKKWSCVWPFPPQMDLELEDFASASDTDYSLDRFEEDGAMLECT
ncbi:hypothetical protein CCR75_001067 [Bremia lactucae]|uniref:Uncharacterized protein n=1 Tax=Bremia lactucae TaxID=4779 RepID=A0A976IGZ1_BRELC|nr:hypothetical protein CCR75_001067 [Bremia lactucae]